MFGPAADRIVIANTKGFTGHAMGAGIEDVVAVKALETGIVPPVANFKEVDPELGPLNLSRGGAHDVEYALRLGAGFGSQISMHITRRVACPGPRPAPYALGYAYRIADPAAWQAWLSRIAGPGAELEVAHRTLRVRDSAAIAPAPPSAAHVGQAVSPANPTPPPAAHVGQAVSPANPAPVSHPCGAAVSPANPAPPPPAPSQTAAESPSSVQKLPRDPVADEVLSLFVEKTGYPREMLDFDLDLEADLGIDTVKQAEIFAAIRQTYGIARDPNLKLRDLPTLARVIQFVRDRRPDLTPAMPAADRVASAPDGSSVSSPMSGPGNHETPRAAGPALAPEDPIRAQVLAVVVEKTGYPMEMLDPELDLEADLGVDTVKQAEIFAAIRQTYGIARDPNLKLRDLPTLARLIQFVRDRRPDLTPAAPAADAVASGPEHSPEPSPMPGPDNHEIPRAAGLAVPPEDPIRAKVLAIVVEKTGYPMEMLDPQLDLEADLGVDTVKQAEMFAAVRQAFGIPRDQSLKLRDFPTIEHVIRFARERAAGAAPPVETERPRPASFETVARIPRRVPFAAPRPPLELCLPTGVALAPGKRVLVVPDCGGTGEALAEKLRGLGVEVAGSADAPGALDGVFWLPALDLAGDLSQLTLAGWREALDIRVKALYRTMRPLYDRIAAPGTFLITATRLGGRHGYDDAGALDPLGGGVTGFAKAYKRERPEALVKAVDFGAAAGAAEIADQLIEEALRDPGAVEIGYAVGRRWTVGLEERAVSAEPGMALGPETSFLITGAAGSIVSAITADLAAASGGTFHLLDVVPEPDPANADLRRFVSDKDGLKRDLFARLQARGERATPALVEKEMAALERAHAALSALQAVRAAGGTAHYYPVNLTDADAVAHAVAEVRKRSGRIDVLLHAGGVERSHALADKDEREFNLVFDVKTEGLFHLLHAIGDLPLGAVVMFSSVAGRFGNSGQTDYSAANDLFCKIASSFRRTRPATRALALDWTAWGGIGMATRGSIPKIMELAGISMLPPEAGIPWIRRELTAAGTSGEVLVAGALGVLGKEWDASGGLDAAALPEMPMLAKTAKIDLSGRLTVEPSLDPAVQPFLLDHVIEGTPVLPGVMGMEAFAEAALALAPGWHVEALEGVDFLVPFKFYRGEPRRSLAKPSYNRTAPPPLPNAACPAGAFSRARRSRNSPLISPAGYCSPGKKLHPRAAPRRALRTATGSPARRFTASTSTGPRTGCSSRRGGPARAPSAK